MRIVGGHSFISPRWSRGIAAAGVSTLCLMSMGVAEVTLVKSTVLALPFDSLRALSTGAAPVAMAPAAARVEAIQSAKTANNPVRPARSGTAGQPAPVAQASADLDRPAPPSPEPAGVATTQSDTIVASDEILSAVPESPSPIAGVPPQLTHAAVESSRSVWSAAAGGGVAIGSAAADGGVAIGQKSKQAGVATAGFFNRLARRVAGSF